MKTDTPVGADQNPDRQGGVTPAPRFDAPAGFYKWLERIALNDLHDAQRALKRQKRDIRREVGPARVAAGDSGARDSLIDVVQRLTAADPTPSRCLAREEAAAAVISSLARLTRDQRDVIRSRYLAGESVASLAQRLDKTEPAIHAMCYRALKELRRLLGSISLYLTSL